MNYHQTISTASQGYEIPEEVRARLNLQVYGRQDRGALPKQIRRRKEKGKKSRKGRNEDFFFFV